MKLFREVYSGYWLLPYSFGVVVFYKHALNAVRGGSANMDVLVVLGTSAAYLFSSVVLFSTYQSMSISKPVPVLLPLCY